MNSRSLSRVRAARPARKLYHCRLEVLEDRLPPGALSGPLWDDGFALAGNPLEPHGIETRLASAAAAPDAPRLVTETAFELPEVAAADYLRIVVAAPTRDSQADELGVFATPAAELNQSATGATLENVVNAAGGTLATTTLDLARAALPQAVPTQGQLTNDADELARILQTAVPGGPQRPALPTAQAGDFGTLPISFEPNVGQVDSQVHFLSRGSGYTLYLTSTEAVLDLQKYSSTTDADGFDTTWVEGHVVRMGLLGANANPEVVGRTPQAGKVNYLVGNDASKWQTDVATFGRVEYQQVYAGIDLVYYGNAQNQLEYDFVVAPGADSSVIGLEFRGAEKVEIDATGDLLLHTTFGAVRQHRPFVYQEVQGARQEITSRYTVSGSQVGFELGQYDATRPLVIDPTLSYATYHGGNGEENGYAIAVDFANSAYAAGETGSANFPTTAGAYSRTLRGITDGFVTKYSPAGNTRVWSTYLGGGGVDRIHSIQVDYNGNAYVTGRTSSMNFPTTAGVLYRTFRGSTYDAFVTKLSVNGNALAYSTYLGGGGNDAAFGIAVDPQTGVAYVAGGTLSEDFPITGNAFQYSNYGTDSFLTRLSANAATTSYSTFFGGGFSNERANSVALDFYGGVYVAGQTRSSDFPTTPGVVQPAYGGGLNDGYVVKFDPTQSGQASLVWGTFVGGADDDYALGVAVDWNAEVYVTGQTNSTNFPTTAGALQTTFRGGPTDAFVMKLNYFATSRRFSTYLGGSGADKGTGIAVTGAGDAPHITGSTTSTNFPTLAAVQATNRGQADAFVTKLRASGNTLDYSTYLGGALDENVSFNDSTHQGGIALDYDGNAYIIGRTQSTNFTTVTPAQGTFGGGDGDAFVAKISDPPIAGELAYFVYVPGTLTVPRNTAFTLTLYAIDGVNQLLGSYRGTVATYSTDPLATLPANYTFTAGDNGIHAFTNGFTFRTAGTHYIIVYDTATYRLFGSAVITVQ